MTEPSTYAERAAVGHRFRATKLVPGWCVRCGCSEAVHPDKEPKKS